MRIIYTRPKGIEPKLVWFHTPLKTDRRRAMLADSITLTAGTITVRAEDGRMLVHTLDTPLAEGIDIRPEHRLVKVRLTRPDVCNSMSSILSMIGDYGINMEEMRLLEINEETSTVTFELTIRGNLLEVPMRKLMFQLSKECSTFRILESF